MKYRADIDGLRAFAIIPVVLYHAGISLFSGGFVGVDIFFVISGYLITTIILNDIDKGKFSIQQFYFRRIKRIFPALYFFLAVTTLLCWFLYLPKDFEAYGKSVYYTVIFVSNIFFKRQSGYFDTESELKPLLHTWSLSVEEQFYIFYPIILIILAKFFHKKYKATIFVIFLASACLSFFGTAREPDAAFFLLPYRAWELMLGAMVALGFFPSVKGRGMLNLLSASGFGMVLASIFLFDHETVFPGYAALLPCVGTALIIFAGQSGGKPLINRFVAFKPFVYIGLVSYSWYLWHWVVFAFRNYYGYVTIDTFLKSNLFLIIFSLLLAVFSYYVVEKPFRDIKWENRRKLFAFAASVMLLFIAVGYAIKLNDGFRDRFNDRVNEVLDYSDDRLKARGDDKSTTKYFLEESRYIIGDASSNPSFLLLGDSHALSIAAGIDNLLKESGISGYLAEKGRGVPFIDVTEQNNRQDERIEFMRNAMEFIKASDEIKTVILAARWDKYINDVTLVKKENGKMNPIDDADRERVFEEEFTKTVAMLISLGKRVVILSNVPETEVSVPFVLAKSEYISTAFPSLYKEIIVDTPINKFLDSHRKFDSVLNTVKDKYDIDIIYLHEAMCDDDLCRFSDEKGMPYLFDANHLTTYGARFVADRLKDDIISVLR